MSCPSTAWYIYLECQPNFVHIALHWYRKQLDWTTTQRLAPVQTGHDDRNVFHIH